MKYAISQEGINSLQELKNRIVEAMRGIHEAIELLESTIQACGEGLGVYQDELLELIVSIKRANDEGIEGASMLALTLIPQQIERIEELLYFGYAGDDDPGPKVKTLSRSR